MKQSTTLCWDCRRATGGRNGCSWSRRFKPVEGWEAEETQLRMQKTTGKKTWEKVRIRSYIVKRCPEFVPDRPGKNSNGY